MPSIEDYISTKKPDGTIIPPRVVTPVKPGYKTSEFWLLCASFIVSLLIFVNVVGPGDHTNLIDTLSKGFEWLAYLLPQSFFLVRYFKNRSQQRALEQQKQIEEDKAKAQQELAQTIQKIVDSSVENAVRLLKENPPVQQEEVPKKKVPRKKT